MRQKDWKTDASLNYKIENLMRDLDLDPEYYYEYEQRFIKDMFRRTFPLTEPQKKYLDRIWEKHLER